MMQRLTILAALITTATAGVAGVAVTEHDARAQQAPPDQLNVALYAPAASFADSSARLAYVQGLAKAIAQKTGVPTTGKAYVRLGDLMAAKPDFAVIDGQCLATKLPGTLLAVGVTGGDVSQPWALFVRSGDSFPSLKGKKLAYVKTGCRDGEFIDNAMLDGEIKSNAYFGSLVDKPDAPGAVASVRDYRAADAVFAPAGQGKGLTKLYDAGGVPNPGFVALSTRLAGNVVDDVKAAVLGYGGGGGSGIDSWRPAAAAAYGTLGTRMGARTKRGVLIAPDVVRLDDQDVLLVPVSKFETATVRQHFWEPTAGEQ